MTTEVDPQIKAVHEEVSEVLRRHVDPGVNGIVTGNMILLGMVTRSLESILGPVKARHMITSCMDKVWKVN